MMHFDRLDGLRGVAISLVFLAHFLLLAIDETLFFPYGSLGVRIFFALSGFLITRALIKGRDSIDHAEVSHGYVLKAFYARRSLRIFTAYYLWLAFNLLLFGAQERTLWDFLYLSNFYDIFVQNGVGNHYWSLAVEEQFYLIWPFVILYSSRRYLLPIMWIVLVLPFFIRPIMAFNEVDYLVLKKLPFLCLDSLGIGALIAYYYQYHLELLKSYFRRVFIALLVSSVGITTLCIVCLKIQETKGALYSGFLHSGFCLFAGACVLYAIFGERTSLVSKIMMMRWLRYLGAISYGCYLYHLFVRAVVDRFWSFEQIDSLTMLMINFLLKCLLSVVVASVSWYLLEKPVNSLKKHFPMKRA